MPCVRHGCVGSVEPLHAARYCAPGSNMRVCSSADRGRSGCKAGPGQSTERTGTSGRNRRYAPRGQAQGAGRTRPGGRGAWRCRPYSRSARRTRATYFASDSAWTSGCLNEHGVLDGALGTHNVTPPSIHPPSSSRSSNRVARGRDRGDRIVLKPTIGKPSPIPAERLALLAYRALNHAGRLCY